MSASPSGLSCGIADIDLDLEEENEEDPTEGVILPFGRIPMSRDQRSTLVEILRCAVCFEIPKSRPNLQVRACENGHHFCTYCHIKLKTCAICRGRLFNGRNFVVEELISKLGKPFGLIKPPFPVPPPPPLIPKGIFKCPHCRKMKMPSVAMLTHIRQAHGDALKDQLRSNPYTKWFEIGFPVENLAGDRNVMSFQVSDMGLLTLVINYPPPDTAGRVKVWLQELRGNNPSPFIYRISLINERQESFGFVDVPVLNYAQAERDNPTSECPAAFQPAVGKTMFVCLLVARTCDAVSLPQAWPTVWNEQTIFSSDRASRKCAARNRRKNKIRRLKTEASKKGLKDVQELLEDDIESINDFDDSNEARMFCNTQ